MRIWPRPRRSTRRRHGEQAAPSSARGGARRSAAPVRPDRCGRAATQTRASPAPASTAVATQRADGFGHESHYTCPAMRAVDRDPQKTRRRRAQRRRDPRVRRRRHRRIVAGLPGVRAAHGHRVARHVAGRGRRADRRDGAVGRASRSFRVRRRLRSTSTPPAASATSCRSSSRRSSRRAAASCR